MFAKAKISKKTSGCGKVALNNDKIRPQSYRKFAFCALCGMLKDV